LLCKLVIDRATLASTGSSDINIVLLFLSTPQTLRYSRSQSDRYLAGEWLPTSFVF